jgi:uncharacterized protein (TIGR02996 family)
MPDNAFLQAINDSPDDDTPRLICADWLDDHGDPDRAEFIRTQCQLARLPEDAPETVRLRKRERELLNEHQLEWVEPLLIARPLDWLFRRGFPAWVTLSADDFIHHGERLLAESTVRRVRLVGAAGKLAALGWCKHLALVTKLNLTDTGLVDDDLIALARSPYLGALTGLDLSKNRITAVGLHALRRKGILARLTRLDVSDATLGNSGTEVLLGAPGLGALRRLDLNHCRLGDAAVEALAGAGTVPALERLSLVGNSGVTAAGVRALAAATTLPRLTDLRLGQTACGNEGLRALAASPLLARLRRLDVGAFSRDGLPPVTAEGLGALLSSPHLQRIRSLRFEARDRSWRDRNSQRSHVPPASDEFRLTTIDAADLFSALRASGLPSGVTSLRLRGFNPPAEEAGRPNPWPDLPRLEHLEIDGANLWSANVTALAAVIGPSLRRLSVMGFGLADEGMRRLLDSPSFAQLEEIHLLGDVLPFEANTLQAIQASPRIRLHGADLDTLLRRDDWPLPWRRWLTGPRLQSLLVTHERTNLGDPDVEKLAELPLLERLLELDLFLVRCTAVGARALARSSHLRNLRSLRLSFSAIGDEGAIALANSPHLANLRTLKLSFCGIGDVGAAALAASPHLTRLTTLKLWGHGANLIGDPGARAIARSATLARLVFLRLRDNAIGDVGAVALAESPHFRHMRQLNISGNPIGPEAMARLEQRFEGRLGYAIGQWDEID